MNSEEDLQIIDNEEWDEEVVEYFDVENSQSEYFSIEESPRISEDSSKQTLINFAYFIHDQIKIHYF